MFEDYDKFVESLLARSTDGFLKLEQLLDDDAFQASRKAKADLEKILAAAGEFESTTILVVDDDDTVRNVICRQLQRRNYRTHQVESPEAAWEYMEQALPQVIVSDVIMPGTNGLEFLSQVMYRYPDMVMVLCSGAPDIQMTIEALRMGATDFLVKPIDYDMLTDSIERGLQRRKSRFEQLRYQLNLELIVSERSRRLIEYSEALEERTRQLGLAYRDVVVRLGRASQWRDDETGAHVQRIGVFSSEIARHMGLAREHVELIAEAAPLHDIGKIGVPDSILLKPGRLTPEEFDIMKNHTVIGAAILSGAQAPLLKASEEIALTHHEWYNGGGYPQGLSGTDIPTFGQIVAVVDVYDALIHQRAYKKALPFHETISTIKARRGSQFAPAIVDAFMDVVERFPGLERKLAESTQIINSKYGVRMGLFKTDDQKVGAG